MDVDFIENAALRVGVATAYGARVVSLVDKASGREWLTQGGRSTNTGEAAHYSVAEAVGWDECFPTVSAWDATATAWGRRLRDHGDLWGRPWTIDATTPTGLTTSFSTAEFRFTRSLELDGAALLARYAVENRTAQPLPYLWALHALLTVTKADRILLPGIEKVRVAGVSLGGKPVRAAELAWSGDNGALPFSLDSVQPASSALTAKLHAGNLLDNHARVGRDGAWLDIAWSENIHDLGIWLTYGGWPAPGGQHEIALEPTSSSADHLGQAIDAGFPPLAPGEHRAWWVRLSVGP